MLSSFPCSFNTRGDTRAWPLRDVAGHRSHLCFKPEGSWLWQNVCMQANARLSWGILHCVGPVTDLHSEGFNFHRANGKNELSFLSQYRLLQHLYCTRHFPPGVASWHHQSRDKDAGVMEPCCHTSLCQGSTNTCTLPGGTALLHKKKTTAWCHRKVEILPS